MSESTHTLVRLPNGAVKPFPAGHPALEADDVEILDGPAVDEHGTPFPTVYPDPEAPAEAQTSAGYAALTNAALRDEVGRRNERRQVDDQLAAGGNKADLVAELERDDLEQAADVEHARQTGVADAGTDQTPEA